jgi:hypothetical protein
VLLGGRVLCSVCGSVQGCVYAQSIAVHGELHLVQVLCVCSRSVNRDVYGGSMRICMRVPQVCCWLTGWDACAGWDSAEQNRHERHMRTHLVLCGSVCSVYQACFACVVLRHPVLLV